MAVASLVVLLFGGQAIAQNELEGLDLSGDTKKDDKKKDKDKDEGLDLSGTTAPEKDKDKDKAKPAEPDRKPIVKKDEGPAVERDITQDDRVKSVQRKLYMKRNRVELSPMAFINVNDPYYTKVGGAVRLAFYPADTLAFSARFALFQTLATDDVRTAKKNLQARMFASVPIWAVLGDVEWSPFYGKISIFNTILHFDGYLIAGGGVVYSEMTPAPDPDAQPGCADTACPKRGVSPAFDLGFGLRFVTKDWLAVNVGLINTTYVERPAGTSKGSTNNLMMLHIGVSIFFPFRSSFREAE